jgi:hypothetical protein
VGLQISPTSASRFVIAKRKAPAFFYIFKYTRLNLASNFDIADRKSVQLKNAMPNTDIFSILLSIYKKYS